MPNSKLSPSAPDFTTDYVCRCRLADIMKERNIETYAEVSNRTGIFVTVVRKLAQRKTKGIDFDTITRLCLGLGVTPSQLFEIDARNEKDASSPQ